MSKHKGTRFFLKAAALACVLIQIWATACASAGDPKNVSAAADDKRDGRVALFDPALSLVPPAGFKSLDIKQVKIKLADNESPRNIFADADQTGYVMVDYIEELEMGSDGLARAKGFTERTQRDLAPWITSEIVEMSKREWWHFETEDPVPSELEALVAPAEPGKSKAKASPTPKQERMHSNAYSTVFKNKLLRFTFESSVDNYQRLKDSFGKSIQSIQIKD